MSTETETKKEVLTRRWEKNDKRTIYAVIGAKGAIHFWFGEATFQGTNPHKYGGVECHWRIRPEWASHRDQPDHPNCWLLNGPCWHDGSSLYAEENYIPRYEGCEAANDFEPLWRALEYEYEKRFKEDGE